MIQILGFLVFVIFILLLIDAVTEAIEQHYNRCAACGEKLSPGGWYGEKLFCSQCVGGKR